MSPLVAILNMVQRANNWLHFITSISSLCEVHHELHDFTSFNASEAIYGTLPHGSCPMCVCKISALGKDAKIVVGGKQQDIVVIRDICPYFIATNNSFMQC
jgi:hypothetical protein